MWVIIPMVVLVGCSARYDAGLAVDPIHQDEYEKILGTIRISQDVAPNGQFYYEHISHITTNDDKHGINLFGFNYRIK